MEATNGRFCVELWNRSSGDHLKVSGKGDVREILEYWFQDFIPCDDHARHCINTLEEWAQPHASRELPKSSLRKTTWRWPSRSTSCAHQSS